MKVASSLILGFEVFGVRKLRRSERLRKMEIMVMEIGKDEIFALISFIYKITIEKMITKTKFGKYVKFILIFQFLK